MINDQLMIQPMDEVRSGNMQVANVLPIRALSL